jgi:hypothetical protein
MQKRSRRFCHLMQLTAMLLTLVIDAVRFLRLCLRSPAALTTENLFLRKQLSMYQERQVKSQRDTDTTRIALVWLDRWFDWRQAVPAARMGVALPYRSPAYVPGTKDPTAALVTASAVARRPA